METPIPELAEPPRAMAGPSAEEDELRELLAAAEPEEGKLVRVARAQAV
jgi:hypothetical protein